MSPTLPLESPSGQARQRVVLGVDTRRDQHTAAVVAINGRLCGCREFSTTAQGCHDLLAWSRALGEVGRAGVECTGS